MLYVLLADDEHWVIKGLEKQIDWEKYNLQIVDVATNGQEAYDKILTHKPDIVISDIRMPLLSGIELIRKCRQSKLGIKFILLSGYSDFKYAQEAIKLDAYDYIIKPISSGDLLSVLLKAKEDLLKEREEAKILKTVLAQDNYISYTSTEALAYQVKEYIEQHFHEDINLKKTSLRFHLNESYMSQVFSKHIGTSFTTYLRDIRMNRAAYLLQHTDSKIMNIALMVGYKDYTYFKRVFKQLYEVPPSTFRRITNDKQ